MINFKEFIKEGGRAVKGSVRINQENVKDTLKSISIGIVRVLKITDKDTGLLGSTGKKRPGGSSGDIDMAIDANKVLRANGIQLADELFDFIAHGGPFEERVARYYFKQFTSGLNYCHTNVICNRDLKLENVLLDSEYKIKIADFGFGSLIERKG